MDAYRITIDNLYYGVICRMHPALNHLTMDGSNKMPASKKRSYARYTVAAVDLLGKLIQTERKSQRITALELAARLGVDRSTLQRLEHGDPKVEVGVAFEACAILGIPLFGEDTRGLTVRLDEASKRLALLPDRVRPKQLIVSDAF